MDYIDTVEAAKILGVSIYRIWHYINEPCPDCGHNEYEKRDGVLEIRQEFSKAGCTYCNFTGKRLPTYGRFEGTNKWRLREEDVLKLVDARKPGYPKGRKRRKKVVR